MWVLKCFVRWSLLMKRFWHWLHSKRLSPAGGKKASVDIVKCCGRKHHQWIQHVYDFPCIPLDRPVCVLECRCNSSLRVKRFPQNTQLHTKGLSPVCSRTWALSSDVFLNVFSQPGTWQMCFRFPTSPGLQCTHCHYSRITRQFIVSWWITFASVSPLVCIFTVRTRACHTPLLFTRLTGQFQGEGLIYLESGLAWSCCQLEPSTLHRLDCEVLLAW